MRSGLLEQRDRPLARRVDLRSEAQTSSLAGTPAEYVLERGFEAFPETASPRAAALAQERSYSTYGATELATPAPAVVADSGDGIAPLPFALAVFGALVVGLGAGSALHLARARRHAGLAT
jgi:hypothetical protein